MRQSRRPGRPPHAQNLDGRARLVQSAATLFATHGFDAVSLRQIATQAGVTPAMIAYYFGDKQGLLTAVLDEGIGRLLARIEALVASAGDDEPFIERFLETYIGVINQDPWIPQLVVREVLSKDGPYRQKFIDQFARRAAALVPPRLAAEIEAGRLRRDLDPRLTLMSLIGMCLFPYIAAPVLGPVLGYRLDDEFGEALIAHTRTLFLDGARGPS